MISANLSRVPPHEKAEKYAPKPVRLMWKMTLPQMVRSQRPGIGTEFDEANVANFGVALDKTPAVLHVCSLHPAACAKPPVTTG